MKTSSFLTLTAMLAAAAAHGQETGYSFPQPIRSPEVGYHHASTYQEGLQRGMADRIRAMGEYNYNTAAASLIVQEARKVSLANDLRRVEIFWNKKEVHRSHTARSVRVPQESRVKAQPASVAVRQTLIDPSEPGFVWPAALNHSAFARSREQMTSLDAELAADRVRIRNLSAGMRSQLGDLVRELPPMDYVEARHFLDRMISQSSRPLQGQVAASN